MLYLKYKKNVGKTREESEQRRKEMEHELRQVNDADKQYEDMETISEDEQEVIQEKIDEEIGKTYVTADLLLDDRDYDEIFNRNPQVHIESLKNMVLRRKHVHSSPRIQFPKIHTKAMAVIFFLSRPLYIDDNRIILVTSSAKLLAGPVVHHHCQSRVPLYS